MAFAEETQRVLRDVGWYPGRLCDISPWELAVAADGFPPLHLAARRFLAEFGGLSFPYGGAGVTRARENLSFDPLDCDGEADRFIGWSAKLSREIAPIGELAGNTCSATFLGMDEHGEIYGVVDYVDTFGRMPIALDHLILGYMPVDIG